MKRHLLLCSALGAVSILGLSLAACSSDDETPSTPDAGAETDAGNTTDSGGNQPPPTLSAYERLGGSAGVRTFVSGEVAKVLEDATLSTYFFNQVAETIPEGHPSGAQIIECFSRLVGMVLEAETYPGAPVNDPENTNTQNFTCRAMGPSHVGLRIGGGTFDAFVGVLAADLMPLVAGEGEELTVGKISQAEFDAVAAALVGTKSAIVDPEAPEGPAPFTAP